MCWAGPLTMGRWPSLKDPAMVWATAMGSEKPRQWAGPPQWVVQPWSNTHWSMVGKPRMCWAGPLTMGRWPSCGFRFRWAGKHPFMSASGNPARLKGCLLHSLYYLFPKQVLNPINNAQWGQCPMGAIIIKRVWGLPVGFGLGWLQIFKLKPFSRGHRRTDGSLSCPAGVCFLFFLILGLGFSKLPRSGDQPKWFISGAREKPATCM